jgi:hypothetical protein
MVLLRLLAAAAFCAALPFAAHAAETGGHGASGSGNRIRANFSMTSDLAEDEEVHVDESLVGPRVVDIPTLTLPSFADGELRGYFFVSARLVAAEGVDAWKIRDKAHLIRDALIRAGHRRSIADPERPGRVDMELARSILLEGLSSVVPLAEVERLEIVNVDSPAS